MDRIIKELEERGYRVILTIGPSGGNYYQLQKDGITYPEAENAKDGVSERDILYIYKKYDLDDVLRMFKPAEGSKLPIYTQKAKAAYRKRTDSLTMTINPKTEPDIAEWLNAQSNKSGAVKELIRQAIANQ